ncbi:hypothetical protein AB0B48_08345 [Micromonospora sp. NPDC049089]|uniref:hypothetical protein n=1 Tax=Micromonospora sp. NPDC049089 TaxID=3155496 RepID=UPI003409BB64
MSGADLIQALHNDWPSVVVVESVDGQDPAREVSWIHGAGKDQVEGSAHESGQCIYLDGQERPVAEFVAWYRRLVPDDRAVILCDDSYNFDAVVDPGSGVEEVISLFPK